MKAFGLSLGTMLLRYYLMMLVVVVAGFSGMWWLSALALPIFLSTILGIKFGKEKESENNIKRLKTSPRLERKAG